MIHNLHVAIGDVHGCYDKLVDLLFAVKVVARKQFGLKGNYTLVFLGDYIDRGPDNPAVIDRLQLLQRNAESADKMSGGNVFQKVVCVKGNHEDLAVKAYDESELLGIQQFCRNTWLRNGGQTTLDQFAKLHPEDASQELASKKFAAMRAWAKSLPLTYEVGRYLFCHAGVDVLKSLEDQTEEDFLWTRKEPIQEVSHWYGRHVVYGHTPTRDTVPRFGYCATNCDTGAYADDRPLSAVFIDPAAEQPLGYCNSASLNFYPRPEREK